jgi:hypothetical protein
MAITYQEVYVVSGGRIIQNQVFFRFSDFFCSYGALIGMIGVLIIFQIMGIYLTQDTLMSDYHFIGDWFQTNGIL